MTEEKKALNENELDDKQLDEVSGGLYDPSWDKSPEEKFKEMQEWVDAHRNK